MDIKYVLFTISIIITFVVLFIFLNLSPQSPFMNFEPAMQIKFQGIQLGDTKSVVFITLGVPLKTTEQFGLPKKRGLDEVFARAKKSLSVEYVTWVNGANWFYCIGFDKVGLVVFKGEGHS